MTRSVVLTLQGMGGKPKEGLCPQPRSQRPHPRLRQIPGIRDEQLWPPPCFLPQEEGCTPHPESCPVWGPDLFPDKPRGLAPSPTPIWL